MAAASLPPLFHYQLWGPLLRGPLLRTGHPCPEDSGEEDGLPQATLGLVFPLPDGPLRLTRLNVALQVVAEVIANRGR